MASRNWASAGLTVAIALAGARARSQPEPSAAASRAHDKPTLILKREGAGSGAHWVVLARDRMKHGDCAGALDAFDAALRTVTDPALYRDRGLCHEKLAQPYPAIDDYRVYLTAEPDAPDADDIRARLEELTAQTAGPPARSADGAKHGESAVRGATTASGAASAHDDTEGDDIASRSSLRRGRGFALGPFLSAQKWFAGGTSFGEGDTWSESVGPRLSYSFGPAGSLVGEVGYERFDATDLDPLVVSGLTSQVAWAFRLPLDQAARSQILIAPGIGYEYLVSSSGQGSSTGVSEVVPRARLAYRRMLSESAGIDFGLDAGVGLALATHNFVGTSRLAALTGLDVALVWGL